MALRGALLHLYICLQVAEACRPEQAVTLKPAIDLHQRLRVESIDAAAAFPPLRIQIRLPKQPQMLRDGRPANRRKPPGQLAGRSLTLAKTVQNRPAGRIGHGSVKTDVGIW